MKARSRWRQCLQVGRDSVGLFCEEAAKHMVAGGGERRKRRSEGSVEYMRALFVEGWLMGKDGANVV